MGLRDYTPSDYRVTMRYVAPNGRRSFRTTWHSQLTVLAKRYYARGCTNIQWRRGHGQWNDLHE